VDIPASVLNDVHEQVLMGGQSNVVFAAFKAAE